MTFTYTVRSVESWAARAGKKFDGQVSQEVARKFVRGLQSVPVPSVTITTPTITTPTKTKKGPRSVCSCGHDLSQHCTEPPMQHWPSSEGAFGFFFCIAEHCEACDCWAFRNDDAVVPSMKRRKADDWTLCATCGHRKGLHCHASRKPVIPGTYQGFVFDGVPYGCKHGPKDGGRDYVCNSSSCAEIDCACQRFRNPLLRPRKTEKRSKPSEQKFGTLIPREALLRAHENYLQEQAAQAGPTIDKAKVLIEVVRENPALTITQLVEASGMSASWVRKNLRQGGLLPPAKPRKQTSFTTGQIPMVTQGEL